MPYKPAIVTLIFILLLAAAGVAYSLLPNAPGLPGSQKTKVNTIDLTNRIHLPFYKDAKDTWNANLQPASLQSSYRLRLEWEKPQELYNHFVLTITDTQSGWTRSESGEHERVSLDLSDLKADTKYTFVLQACLDADCSTWLISDREPQARTEKMIWNVEGEYTYSGDFVPGKIDTSKWTLVEDWESMVTLSEVDLRWPDETLFTAEEKLPLTIQGVYLEAKSGKQYLKLQKSTDNGKMINFYATLLNP